VVGGKGGKLCRVQANSEQVSLLQGQKVAKYDIKCVALDLNPDLISVCIMCMFKAEYTS